jgi:4-hydroxy-3-methylbut-2-en-1-yl diphosphate reductase
MMESGAMIRHYNQHIKEEVETRDWLPAREITVGITAGASCPNNLIEDTIRRIFELKGVDVAGLLQS